MSGLSLNTQTNIAFKNLLNKSHTDVTKGLGNESEDIKFNIHSDTIFVSVISSTPATAVTAGVAVLVNADLTLDGTSNGHAFFATWPITAPIGTDPVTTSPYAYGAGVLTGISAGQRVKNAISFAYGNGYEAIPYTGSPIPANRIFVNDPRNWVHQYQSGIFYQENIGSTPVVLTLYAYTGDILTNVLGSSSNAIPLAGTNVGHPVTGDIEMSDGTKIYLNTSPATYIKFTSDLSPSLPTIEIAGSIFLVGDLTVTGTTTTVHEQTVQIEDNNIVLNYGGTHSTANGGGITIQDAISTGVPSVLSTDANGQWLITPGFTVYGLANYDIDRSGSYTNRSLVDKQYVDSKTPSANNGLNVSGSNIQLGGPLITNTTIDNAGFDLNIFDSITGFELVVRSNSSRYNTLGGLGSNTFADLNQPTSLLLFAGSNTINSTFGAAGGIVIIGSVHNITGVSSDIWLFGDYGDVTDSTIVNSFGRNNSFVSSNNIINIGVGNMINTSSNTTLIGQNSTITGIADKLVLANENNFITYDTAGIINISGFVGVGSRAVQVDASGNLFASNSLPDQLWELVGSDIMTSPSLTSPAIPNVLPAVDDAQDLGSYLHRWKDLYLGSMINFSTVLDMVVGGGSPDDYISTFDTTGLTMFFEKVIKSTNGGGQIDLDYLGNADNVAITTDSGVGTETFVILDPTYLKIGSVGAITVTGSTDVSLKGNGSGIFTSGTVIGEVIIADVQTISSQNDPGYTPAPVMLSAKGAQIGVGTNSSALIGGNDNSLGNTVTESVIIGGETHVIHDASTNIVMIGGTGNSVQTTANGIVVIGGNSMTIPNTLNGIVHGDDTFLETLKSIKSLNGDSQIELDHNGVAGNILIKNDASFLDSGLALTPGVAQLLQLSANGVLELGTANKIIRISETGAGNNIELSCLGLPGSGAQIFLQTTSATDSSTYSEISYGTAANASQVYLEAHDNVSGVYATIDVRPYDTIPVIEFALGTGEPVLLSLNGTSQFAEFQFGLGSSINHSKVLDPTARQLIDSVANPVVDWTNAAAQGVVYDQDYSATYVNRSLVDKEYVDAAIAGGTGTKYATTLAFVSDVTQTITHSLGDTDIIVELIDLVAGEKLWGAQVNNYTTNTVDITLAASIASVRVIIKK